MGRRRLRQSPKPRLRQRTVLIYAAAATLVTIAIGAGVFIYMNLGNSRDSLANKNRQEYNSSGTGDWEDAATWEKSQSWMDDTPGNDVNIRFVNVRGYITRSGNLRVAGNTTMTIYDTLRIIGDLELTGGASLKIEEDGLLIVENDYITSGGARTINEGHVVEIQNLRGSGGSSIQNNNNFYVYGEATGTDGSRFNGSQNNPKNANFGSEDELMQDNPQLYEFASGMVVMPITLAYFRAEKESDQTLLEWKTVNEDNNDFFTIERSRNGKQFEILDQMTGAGNSDVELSYEFVDDDPFNGANYYRLKQTDFNGDFEYFNIVLVHHDKLAGDMAPITIDRIGPNPFQQQFTINFTLQESTDVRLTLTNAHGQQIAEVSYRAYSGSNDIIFQKGSQLSPGVYLVTLSYGNHTSEPVRLIKR